MKHLAQRYGVITVILEMGILTKQGNSYIYSSPVDGTEIKMFQKAWKLNSDGCLDRVMAEFDKIKKRESYNIADKNISDENESTIEIIEEEA